MKLPTLFTIFDLRFTIWKKSKTRTASVFNRQSSIVNRNAKQGIALIITLIMLAVTLVMAVAFLALARRERAAVSTTTDTTTARFAADSALNAAQSQIMANLLNLNSAHTSSNSLYNFGLVVSTNYINANGFNPTLGNDPVNVNYSFTSDNSPYSAADFIQNVANLQFLPRAPVFITTNTQTGSNEFRFYLDLNRNGIFEDSGSAVPNIVINNGTISTNGFVTAAGDPQWIGVLARPDTMHSPNNQFVSRYAFLAEPIGNALDINYIHNEGSAPLTSPFSAAGVNYRRNQGVGSWELNLAAFLTDLNTNTYAWNSPGYIFDPVNGNYAGLGLQDAAAIYAYRLNGSATLYNYNTLALSSAQNALNNNNPPGFVASVFGSDRIDAYSDGPLQTTTALPLADNDASLVAAPWPGGTVTNRYTDLTSELFDTTHNKVSVNFNGHLIAPGTNVSSYDRYTFYRMLSQLGTDSDPDAGKMNLNYSNVLVNYNNYGVVTSMTVIPGAETNLVPWTATNFFMAAADRMLRLYTTNWFVANPSNYLATYYGVTNLYRYSNINGDFVTNDPTGFGLTNFNFGGVAGDGFLNLTNQIPAFGITNIPVYVNGQFVYSSAINRILQLAANLYDASTTNFYPSVFKPVFEQDNFGDVFIVGFRQVVSVSGNNDHQLNPPYDVSQLYASFPAGVPMISAGSPVNGDYINVYGVPWIIGAKKGFPNFNKLGMQNVVQVTRKLQVKRSENSVVGQPNSPLKPSDLIITNQLYAFSISNSIGIECWNSYTNAYPHPVQINVFDAVSMMITNNGNTPSVMTSNIFNNSVIVSSWSGSTNQLFSARPGFTTIFPNSFVVPVYGRTVLLTNADYYTGTTAPPPFGGFYPDWYNYGWESNNPNFYLPQFELLTTNRLQLSMIDTFGVVGHIIDYVQLSGPESRRNLNSVLQTNSTEQSYDNMWAINTYNNTVPYGIQNQWDASTGTIPPNSTYWRQNPFVSGATTQDEIDGFRYFLGLSAINSANAAAAGYYATNYVVQLPYTPTATIVDYTAWQVNDPMVHYMASDLTFFGTENNKNLSTGIQKLPDSRQTIPLPSYAIINERYQPWGTNTQMAQLSQVGVNEVNASSYNLMCKDPLVWGSDYWDFPTNVYPAVGWIGRVHRGTPWQTVYLKAHNVLDGSVIGTNTWAAWSGNYSAFDAANGGPLQDRMLFDLFTTRFNDNAAYGTLSVNVGAGSSDPSAGLAAWSAVFSGMEVITNTTVVPQTVDLSPQPLPPVYGATNIPPAGASGLNSPLGNLVSSINNARTNFVNPDGVKGSFEHVGDILSALALTEQSPFLSWTNRISPAVQNQQRFGISDEAYEWLPQQMMGLVRVESSPRYVVYAYGQALRPAPNALVTAGGNNFGLVTNYQVVAESAVRAIVSVQQNVTNSATGPVTNYTTKVESYSVLPPN